MNIHYIITRVTTIFFRFMKKKTIFSHLCLILRSEKSKPIIFATVKSNIMCELLAEALAPAQSSVRPCETKSLRFEGFCMVEDNCANVCRTEGFVDGRCSTFVRNCICIKPC